LFSCFNLKIAQFPPAPLVIEDPFNPTHNIGQGVFDMWRVQQAFEEAHTTLFGHLFSAQFESKELIQMLLNVKLSDKR
jgi:hypothetical protein